MGTVVSLRGAAKTRAKAAPSQRKRKRRVKPKNPDHIWLANTVVETTSIYGEGEANFAHRHRITLRQKGGLAENLYDYGAREYLVGDVSEMIGPKKWTTPKLGMIPTESIVSIVLAEREGAPLVAVKPAP